MKCCLLDARLKCLKVGYGEGKSSMKGGNASLSSRDYRGVFFDAGGTLIFAPLEEVFTDLCARHGVNVELEKVFDAYRTFVREDGSFFRENRHKYVDDPIEFWTLCNKQMLNFLGVEKDLDSLAERITRDYPGPEGVEWRMYEDVPKALEELSELDCILGVISNFSSVLKEIFGRLGLAHHFQMILSSSDVRILKPDPEIFLIALERTGVKPRESIYVGNAYDPDVVGSRKAGMTSVLIDRENQIRDTDCLKISHMGELVALLQ
jgi:REG-2-like HAD superfamily hydrolase